MSATATAAATANEKTPTKTMNKKDVPRINILHVNEQKNSDKNNEATNNLKVNNSNSATAINNNNNNNSNKLHVDNNYLSLHDPANKHQSNLKNNIDNNNKKKKLHNPCKIFRRAVPIMPKPLAVICCIANIFIPGSGTLVSAFSILCCGTKHRCKKNIVAFFVNFFAFLLQLGSACIIFGWIWSIKYGIFFVHLADQGQDEITDPDLPLYCRRHSSVDTTVLMYQPIKPRLSITLNQLKEDQNSN